MLQRYALGFPKNITRFEDKKYFRNRILTAKPKIDLVSSSGSSSVTIEKGPTFIPSKFLEANCTIKIEINIITSVVIIY